VRTCESKAFLRDRGVDLSGDQQTKTKTALRYFSKSLASRRTPRSAAILHLMQVHCKDADPSSPGTFNEPLLSTAGGTHQGWPAPFMHLLLVRTRRGSPESERGLDACGDDRSRTRCAPLLSHKPGAARLNRSHLRCSSSSSNSGSARASSCSRFFESCRQIEIFSVKHVLHGSVLKFATELRLNARCDATTVS
jgi:hypothetical protein